MDQSQGFQELRLDFKTINFRGPTFTNISLRGINYQSSGYDIQWAPHGSDESAEDNDHNLSNLKWFQDTSTFRLEVLVVLTPKLTPVVPTTTSLAKETWFFMRTGQKFERQDETRESMELEAKSKIDDQLRQALTDEDSGILKPGLLPKVDAATPAGSKALLASISQAES